MRILLIDNYDSFTYNLYQLLAGLNEGQAPIVVRNDRITPDEAASLRPDRIVISPGPGHPQRREYFGVGMALIRELGPRIPILGICLGHLGLAAAFGARIVPSDPCHGRSSPIFHEGKSLFRDLPCPFDAMRYHSLAVGDEGLPECLVVTARTSQGLIMGLRHKELPSHGLQFHPESIGTPFGRNLVAAFLSDPA